MKTHIKYRTLIWVTGILLATNLSMGMSFLYHKRKDNQQAQQSKEEKYEMPGLQRTRYFREQLDLDPGQVDIFRQLNRDFNQKAWQIQNRLSALRSEMVGELGTDNPDMQKLDSVAVEIGELHKHLKSETIDYYLAMKQVCTPEQQENLHKIFMSVLETEEDIRLPQRGRRFRFNGRMRQDSGLNRQ